MRLPVYLKNSDKDHIIIFSTGGWSSHYFAEMNEPYNIDKIFEFANRLIPKEISKHSGNDKVKSIKIYKLQQEIKLDF